MRSHRSRLLLAMVGTGGLAFACNMPWSPAAVSPLASPVAPAPDPTGGRTSWWPLILIAAVAVVVLGLLAVLFLVRRRTAPHSARARTTSVAGGGLRPLPEGAVLNGRYVIRRLLRSVAYGNVYQIEDAKGTPVCGACFTPLDSTGDRFCPKCGVAVQEVPPVELKLLARETEDARAFAGSAQLVDLHLEFESLVLPVAVFSHSVGEATRYYQIEPDVSDRLRVSAIRPASRSQVLAWGTRLARGVEYLHRHYVTALPISDQNVILEGDRARLVCCDGVRVLQQGAYAQASSVLSEDVDRLTSLLLAMASDVSSPSGGEPELSRGLAAWRQAAGGRLTASALLGELRSLARPSGGSAAISGFLVGSSSVVGRVRELNEDSVFVEIYPIAQAHLGIPAGVFAVADGVGGQAAGEVASHIVVEALAERADYLRIEMAKGALPDLELWLARTATIANERVYARRVADHNDMGSTLVVAAVLGNTAVLLNVGDSRAYRLSADGVEQLTTDHSMVQRLVELGQITTEEARNHPRRSVIYRAIGDRPEVSYDLFTVSLNVGDALLLCSDGLTDVVRDESLWGIWRAAESSQQACDRLVDSANQGGGPDNISVVIAQVQ